MLATGTLLKMRMLRDVQSFFAGGIGSLQKHGFIIFSGMSYSKGPSIRRPALGRLTEIAPALHRPGPRLHGDLPAHGRTVLASFGTAFAAARPRPSGSGGRGKG